MVAVVSDGSAVLGLGNIGPAEAIAGLIASDELTEEYIIPSMFDPRVADAVAQATREAAWTSVARKARPTGDQRAPVGAGAQASGG